MIVPAVIFILCLCFGAMAGSRWLPDLAAGQVAGLAFFVVCGLLGAALGLVGLHAFLILEEIENVGGVGAVDHAEIFASGLRDVLWQAGSLLGLAVVVFLLAPQVEKVEELTAELD